jgi:transcriptional regulator of arginine metabolism
MSSVRAERRRWIERLLSDGSIGSQHDLLARLKSEGVASTQATLSRDLADQSALAPTDLAPAVRAYLLNVEVGGTMVVLRTRTGHATPLAVELDRTRLDGSLGTIAGDDTIFMATRSPAIARSIARRLEGMLHGDRARRPARR